MGYFKRKPERSRWKDQVRALDELAVGSRVWETILEQPPRARCFVRFATREVHSESGRRTGIFKAAYEALRSEDIGAHNAEALRTAIAWFNENLASPDLNQERAVFLFKSEATECMRQIWTLVHALRDAGVWTEMQVAKNPGRVIYEDEHQVAVVPWAESTTL